MTNLTTTELHRSLSWVALGGELIDCLKSKGNHRLSRFDAFIWIMERINKGEYERVGAKGWNKKQSFRVMSLERLAQDWNWSKPTVREFLNELLQLHVINLRHEGNALIFSFGTQSSANLVL